MPFTAKLRNRCSQHVAFNIPVRQVSDLGGLKAEYRDPGS
jgi:hypothetical protein